MGVLSGVSQYPKTAEKETKITKTSELKAILFLRKRFHESLLSEPELSYDFFRKNKQCCFYFVIDKGLENFNDKEQKNVEILKLPVTAK
jgi:hypothetical protein